MRCSQVADSLAEVASGTLSIDGQHARHVASCLRCQAELASYRKLFHGLRRLRADVVMPSPGLLEEIFAHLDDPAARTSRRPFGRTRRVAYVGGLAAATAAGAAGAIVFASLSRRGRLAS